MENMSHLIGDLFIFASIILFICSILAFKINRTSPLTKTVTLFCIFSGFGSLMYAGQFYSKSPDMCMFFNKLSYLGWCLLPPIAFHFSLYFSDIIHKIKFKSMIYIAYLPAFLFLYFIFSDNFIIISNFYVKHRIDNLAPIYSNNIYGIACVIYLYILSLLSLLLILFTALNSKLKRLRMLGFIVIMTFVITILIQNYYGIISPNIDYPWLFGFELIIVGIGVYLFIQNLRFSIPIEQILSSYIPNHINEKILITNTDGIIKYTNIAMDDMLATESENIINKHIDKYLQDIYHNFVISGRINNQDFDYIKTNDTIIHLNVNAAQIIDNYGDYIGNIFIFNDLQCAIKLQDEIAERKRIEEVLIKADRERDEFLSLISHELLSPLSAMFLWIDLAKNDKSLQDKSMVIIEENARRQFELVDELLLFTRLQHGKITLNISDANLSEIIDKVLNSDEILCKNINLNNLTCEILMKIDTEKIIRSMISIINFTSEFTDEISINVNDNGCACEIIFLYKNNSQINNVNMNEIFNPFKSEGKKAEIKVSELKMATAQKIIELHHGTLYTSYDKTNESVSVTLQLPK